MDLNRILTTGPLDDIEEAFIVKYLEDKKREIREENMKKKSKILKGDRLGIYEEGVRISGDQYALRKYPVKIATCSLGKGSHRRGRSTC